MASLTNRSATAAIKTEVEDVNSVYSGKNQLQGGKPVGRNGGLTVIGKASGVVRRMPPPPTLPSLRAESQGQDPDIAIVPQGGTGWSNSDTATAVSTAPAATAPAAGAAAVSESMLALSSVSPSTPQCVLCEVYPTSPYGYTVHLYKKHKSTLAKNGVYLRCGGLDICTRRHEPFLVKEFEGKPFTLHKLEEKSTPQCVLCEKYPKSAGGYARHLSDHHKSTLQANGLYLICSCGHTIRSLEYDGHTKKCDGRHFTLHKLEEKKCGMRKRRRDDGKLREAGDEQQFNRNVEDVELWLSELDGQVASEDFGKDLVSVQNLQKKMNLIENDYSAHNVLQKKFNDLELQLYYRECEKADDWMSAREALFNEDLNGYTVESLIKMHEDFFKSFNALEELSTKLIQGQHYDAPKVAERRQALLDRRHRLSERSKEWIEKLAESYKRADDDDE